MRGFRLAPITFSEPRIKLRPNVRCSSAVQNDQCNFDIKNKQVPVNRRRRYGHRRTIRFQRLPRSKNYSSVGPCISNVVFKLKHIL
jgi:hypothetical protein